MALTTQARSIEADVGAPSDRGIDPSLAARSCVHEYDPDAGQGLVNQALNRQRNRTPSVDPGITNRHSVRAF